MTTDPDVFARHDGPGINYNTLPSSANAFHLPNVHLLFEDDIKQQEINFVVNSGYTAFYRTNGGDMGFDIFAATFYLISRYEEYLPYQVDDYGRYAYTNAAAWKGGFLQQPLVHQWAADLQRRLQQRWPSFTVQRKPFRFMPTYDIDMAYAIRYKHWLKSLARGLLQPAGIPERLRVMLGRAKDPFDSFDWLHELHETFNLNPVYFFHVAARNGRYDKQILPQQPVMQHLIADHASRYTVGLHPSWQSGDDTGLLTTEKTTLEAITGQPVTHSRQHYIRLHLPGTYGHLLRAGITNDYSMGYGSINGFRASVAAPFYWFDLEQNQETPLRIHPFCYMDANSYYEQQQTPAAALTELRHYFTICKAVDAPLTTIWHNNFLGTDPVFAGWQEVYARFVDSISAPDA